MLLFKTGGDAPSSTTPVGKRPTHTDEPLPHGRGAVDEDVSKTVMANSSRAPKDAESTNDPDPELRRVQRHHSAYTGRPARKGHSVTGSPRRLNRLWPEKQASEMFELGTPYRRGRCVPDHREGLKMRGIHRSQALPDGQSVPSTLKNKLALAGKVRGGLEGSTDPSIRSRFLVWEPEAACFSRENEAIHSADARTSTPLRRRCHAARIIAPSVLHAEARVPDVAWLRGTMPSVLRPAHESVPRTTASARSRESAEYPTVPTILGRC